MPRRPRAGQAVRVAAAAVGFQDVGPPFSEGLLFDLGELFQQRTRWPLEKPPLQ